MTFRLISGLFLFLSLIPVLGFGSSETGPLADANYILSDDNIKELITKSIARMETEEPKPSSGNWDNSIDVNELVQTVKKKLAKDDDNEPLGSIQEKLKRAVSSLSMKISAFYVKQLEPKSKKEKKQALTKYSHIFFDLLTPLANEMFEARKSLIKFAPELTETAILSNNSIKGLIEGAFDKSDETFIAEWRRKVDKNELFDITKDLLQRDFLKDREMESLSDKQKKIYAAVIFLSGRLSQIYGKWLQSQPTDRVPTPKTEQEMKAHLSKDLLIFAQDLLEREESASFIDQGLLKKALEIQQDATLPMSLNDFNALYIPNGSQKKRRIATRNMCRVGGDCMGRLYKGFNPGKGNRDIITQNFKNLVRNCDPWIIQSCIIEYKNALLKDEFPDIKDSTDTITLSSAVLIDRFVLSHYYLRLWAKINKYQMKQNLEKLQYRQNRKQKLIVAEEKRQLTALSQEATHQKQLLQLSDPDMQAKVQAKLEELKDKTDTKSKEMTSKLEALLADQATLENYNLRTFMGTPVKAIKAPIKLSPVCLQTLKNNIGKYKESSKIKLNPADCLRNLADMIEARRLVWFSWFRGCGQVASLSRSTIFQLINQTKVCDSMDQSMKERPLQSISLEGN